MRILVVDDEAPARERLERLVGDIPDCASVASAADGAEAVRLAAALEPDVVLLDIRMPGIDGIEAARHIAAAEPPPAIVFTTAYDEHAVDAFEARAVDYLVKPIRRERLERALAAARQPTRAQMAALADAEARTQLCARIGGELQLVPVADVRYFRAEHKYVTVRHGGGETLLDESLKDLEQEFGERFLRVHRGALVAPAWVGGLAQDTDGGAYVWFHDIPDTVPVSRRHRATVRARLRAAG